MVPGIRCGNFVGVLGIERDAVNTSADTDRIYLEKVVERIVKNVY